MKILIAIKGLEGAEYFHRVATAAPLERADEIILAHVVDTRPREDLEHGRGHLPGRRPLSPTRRAELTGAEDDRARTVLHLARQALISAGVPEEHLRHVTIRGRPNEELRDLAEREGVDLMVVGGHRDRPGPHSIGKTARFLIDHAPEAALMVR